MANFYTIEKQSGRWWFITPDGARFWSIGMNHIDSAALRYVASDGVWEREFSNSHEHWLRAVADDLRDWGFNTIGWTQEVVIITPGYRRHSRAFTYEEYQWADMPYCHLLPFTEAHQWQVEVRMPDLISRGCSPTQRDIYALTAIPNGPRQPIACTMQITIAK